MMMIPLQVLRRRRQRLKQKLHRCPWGGSASAGSAKVPPRPEGAKCDVNVRCAAGLRCFQRVCQRLTCEDTDAANDPAVQGTAAVTASVSGVVVTRSDKCSREMLEQVACPDAKYGRPEACPAGTSCENGACVNLCGNGRVDPTENCGTCPGDVLCGADERCENNACVSRFFCRSIGGGAVESNQGVFSPRCDTQTDIYTSSYFCSGTVARPQFETQCALGCNNDATACCHLVQQVRSSCETLDNGTRMLLNQTISGCDGRQRPMRVNCGTADPPNSPLTCFPVGEDSARCAFCGQRICADLSNAQSPYVLQLRPEEQCGPGRQDLGIVQC